MEPTETTIAAETTPAEDQAVEETTQQQETEVSQEETKELSAEEKRSQELLDWGIKTYPVMKGMTPEQQVAFLLDKRAEGNREGSRISRELRELKATLARRQLVEESEEPEEAAPEVPAQPSQTVQALTARAASLQTRQLRLADALPSMQSDVNTMQEDLLIAKRDMEQEADPELRKGLSRTYNQIRFAFKQAFNSYNDKVDEYNSLLEARKDIDEAIKAEQANQKVAEQERRQQLRAEQRFREQQLAQVDSKAFELLDAHGLDVGDIDKFLRDVQRRVRYKIEDVVEENPEAGPVDLAKLTEEVIQERYLKAEGKRVIAAKVKTAEKFGQVFPTTPKPPAPVSTQEAKSEGKSREQLADEAVDRMYKRAGVSRNSPFF